MLGPGASGGLSRAVLRAALGVLGRLGPEVVRFDILATDRVVCS